MRPNRPRYKLTIKKSAAQRRRRGVEFMAGLAGGADGFFLFRKRNPVTEGASHPRRISPASEEALRTCLPLSGQDSHEPEPPDESP
jgi:hypothetical protein